MTSSNQDEVTARVIAVVAKYFDEDPSLIAEGTPLSSIKAWDSTAQVGLLLAVEDEFGIEIDLDDLAFFKTVRQLVDVAQQSGK